VTTGVDTLSLRRLDRAGIQPYLPQLTDWLLPGTIFGIQHTWPQLYRGDGRGCFHALFDGPRLVSHLAVRRVTLQGSAGPFRAALIGSVATAPGERGRGLAGRLLAEAMADCRRDGLDAAMLWAERPDLYQRAGFAAGRREHCAVIAAEAAVCEAPVRLATVADHAAIHALHEQKPMRVQRSPHESSGLLTTPGMWATVLEQDGAVVAYACCGKGADLQGWWHELGGPDQAVARLLPSAMALIQQAEGLLILPPYRTSLADLLAHRIRDHVQVEGPMVAAFTAAGSQPFFVDGLDSI
jgi:predicted N-acetyltransferase YhbS